MNKDRDARLRELFNAAIDFPPKQRSAYVEKACQGNPELRAELENLLAHHDDPVGFVETPAHRVAAEISRNDGADERVRADDESTNRLIGRQVGRYRIIKRIGQGGMADVFEAEQERPRRNVALKIVRPGVASTTTLRRFEYEAHLLGQLQHAGIAQIYEAASADTGGGAQPFFAMELICGQPLTEHANSRKLGMRKRLELFVAVCSAVQYAHGKGVIHRDLKPGNILVNELGEPKILDFGVARVTNSDLKINTLQTSFGQLIGTIPYLSPEQATGDSHDLDTRTDVYSLGVILFELLTGQFPYDVNGRLIHEALRVICEEEPIRLSTVDRVFRGDLDIIISKALRKDPDRRYQSASELAGDIQRYLRDEPIIARPPSPLYQLRKLARRNRTFVTAAATSLVILILGVIGTTSGMVWAFRQTKFAEAREKEAEQARDEATWVKDFLVETIQSADPWAGRGADVTVRAVLEAAATRIDAQFAENEEVEAAVHEVIGSTYQSLGVYDRAEKHIGIAVEKRKRLLGNDHPDTVNSMMHQARVFYYLGRYAESEELQRQGAAFFIRTLGDEHPTALQAGRVLAETLYRQNKIDEAIEINQEVLDKQLRVLGENHKDTLATTNDLATGLQHQGRFAEAEPIYRRAIEISRELLGEEHLDTLGAMHNLAHCLQKLNRPAKAEEMFRRVLDIGGRLLGTEHYYVLIGTSNLASLLLDQGRFEEAEPLLRTALKGQQRAIGDHHPATITTASHLSDLLRLKNKLDEAYEIARPMVENARQALGDQHNITLSCRSHFAALLLEMGRLDEAELHITQVLKTQRLMLGEEHPDTLSSAMTAALLLLHQGQADKAEAILVESSAAAESAFPPRSWRSAMFVARHGASLAALGRFEEAESRLLAAYDRLREDVGDAHHATQSTLRNLVDLYQDWGKPEAAREYRQRLVPAGGS